MRIISSICAMVMLVQASNAFGQPGAAPRGMGMMMHVGWGQNCLAQIDLNSQQIDKILLIYKDFDPIREKELVELRGFMIQLRNLSISKSDSAKIAEIEAKIANTKAGQIRNFHNQWARIDAILTPKQKIACTAEYENRMGIDNWRGGMMGMGYGW